MPEPLNLDQFNLDLNLSDNQDSNQDNQASPEFSDFASGILNEIPEEDRSVVSKYLKTWDGNVTKEFQKRAADLEPYKQLGDLEDIQAGMAWVELINNDPIEFFNKFTELLKEAGIMPKEFTLDDDDEEVTSGGSIPKEFMDEFKAMREELSGLKDTVSSNTARDENDAQQRGLDNLLSDMHTKLGEFDDDYVVMQLAKGDCSPQQAVERHNEWVKKFNSPKNPPPPKIFTGGSGNIPQDQVARPKTAKDRMAIVQQALEAARG